MNAETENLIEMPSVKSDVEMLYDASGNRVKKETVDFSSQTCSDPAPGTPGLLITYTDPDGVKDKTIELTTSGDIRTCLPVSTTKTPIPVNALMIQKPENVLIAFSDVGVQFGGQAVLSNILSPNVGDMAVYYAPTSTTGATTVVMDNPSALLTDCLNCDIIYAGCVDNFYIAAKGGSSVSISGTLPLQIINSGVAYVDNASVFVKSSFVDPYTLSYVNFDDGISHSDNTFEFYIKDHLGSTRAVWDEVNGAPPMLIQAMNYLAYGTIRDLQISSEDARKKFTGKEFDEDGVDVANGVQGIRLSYFGARYYDPEIGKWTVVDPAYQYLDAYNYCSNNPIFGVDRNGRDGPNAERYWNPSGVEEGNDAANHDYAFENQTYQAIKVAIAVPVVASVILIAPKLPTVAVAIIPRLYTAYGDAVTWSAGHPGESALIGALLYIKFNQYLPSLPPGCGMADIITMAGFRNIALGWQLESNTMGIFNGAQNSDQSSLTLGSSYFGQSNNGLSDMKLDVSAPTFQSMAADATSTQ